MGLMSRRGIDSAPVTATLILWTVLACVLIGLNAVVTHRIANAAPAYIGWIAIGFLIFLILVHTGLFYTNSLSPTALTVINAAALFLWAVLIVIYCVSLDAYWIFLEFKSCKGSPLWSCSADRSAIAMLVFLCLTALTTVWALVMGLRYRDDPAQPLLASNAPPGQPIDDVRAVPA